MTQSSQVTEYVVKTVADWENFAPDELPPLAEQIDTETYQQLTSFESELTEPITFEYLWYNVTVLPGGEVFVTP